MNNKIKIMGWGGGIDLSDNAIFFVYNFYKLFKFWI